MALRYFSIPQFTSQSIIIIILLYIFFFLCCCCCCLTSSFIMMQPSRFIHSFKFFILCFLRAMSICIVHIIILLFFLIVVGCMNCWLCFFFVSLFLRLIFNLLTHEHPTHKKKCYLGFNDVREMMMMMMVAKKKKNTRKIRVSKWTMNRSFDVSFFSYNLLDHP